MMKFGRRFQAVGFLIVQMLLFCLGALLKQCGDGNGNCDSGNGDNSGDGIDSEEDIDCEGIGQWCYLTRRLYDEK